MQDDTPLAKEAPVKRRRERPPCVPTTSPSNSAIFMSPARPATRGRGRPRKELLDDTSPPKDTPVRRGRGRPRKHLSLLYVLLYHHIPSFNLPLSLEMVKKFTVVVVGGVESNFSVHL